MFRKRHVQISPVVLTMARGDALSFYVKDRHVHDVLGVAWVADQVSPTLTKSGACGG
jgi:hypothetical protein